MSKFKVGDKVVIVRSLTKDNIGVCTFSLDWAAIIEDSMGIVLTIGRDCSDKYGIKFYAFPEVQHWVPETVLSYLEIGLPWQVQEAKEKELKEKIHEERKAFRKMMGFD